MSHERPFDSIIIQPLPKEAWAAFVRQLWGTSSSSADAGNDDNDNAAYDLFSTYYLAQCRHALRDHGKHVSIRTHQDVLDVAELIKAPSRTREEVVWELRVAYGMSTGDAGSEASSCIAPVTLKEHFDNECIHGSIDLVARLLTMTSFGELECGLGQRGHLAWTAGSLRDFLSENFDKRPTFSVKAVQLEKVFNARNLQRFTGMKIEWTDNLVDHLRMCEYDKKIKLFHHVSFLENHKCGILPQNLIDETLKTIALLLPSSDSKVQLWYEKHRLEHDLDPRAAKSRLLRSEHRLIDNFYFWKDRICILKQDFDEVTPKTFSQWWYDRRSGPQWHTFWIAIVVLILTLLFGVIQSVEGAIQVWEALKNGGQ